MSADQSETGQYVESCIYCGEPTAGGEGGYYSLVSGLEVCSQSPTTFHERYAVETWICPYRPRPTHGDDCPLCDGADTIQVKAVPSSMRLLPGTQSDD